MDSVAVGVTCGYYPWIYNFVSDFNDSQKQFLILKFCPELMNSVEFRIT